MHTHHTARCAAASLVVCLLIALSPPVASAAADTLHARLPDARARDAGRGASLGARRPIVLRHSQSGARRPVAPDHGQPGAGRLVATDHSQPGARRLVAPHNRQLGASRSAPATTRLAPVQAQAVVLATASLEAVATKVGETGRKVAMSLIGLALAIASVVLAFRRDFKEAVAVFAVGLVCVLMATSAGETLLQDTVKTLVG